MAKFGAVGVVNTILDYAVLNALLSIGPLKAKVASTIVATTASYFMNRHWTFNTRDRAGLRREYVMFFALNLIGMIIQLAVLGVAKYGLGFTEHGGGDDRLALNLFNALGIAVAMVFRFWAYRAFVFKPVTQELAAEEPATEPATEPAIEPATEPAAVALAEHEQRPEMTAAEIEAFEADLATPDAPVTTPAPRPSPEEVRVS